MKWLIRWSAILLGLITLGLLVFLAEVAWSTKHHHDQENAFEDKADIAEYGTWQCYWSMWAFSAGFTEKDLVLLAPSAAIEKPFLVSVTSFGPWPVQVRYQETRGPSPEWQSTEIRAGRTLHVVGYAITLRREATANELTLEEHGGSGWTSNFRLVAGTGPDTSACGRYTVQ